MAPLFPCRTALDPPCDAPAASPSLGAGSSKCHPCSPTFLGDMGVPPQQPGDRPTWPVVQMLNLVAAKGAFIC